jgi:transcriptional regulator GlxA family with amidase domain
MLHLIKKRPASLLAGCLLTILFLLPKGQTQPAPTINHQSMSENSVSLSEFKKSPMRITCYVQERVEILDLAGPLEVFNYAGWEVYIVGKTKEPIHAQGILKVTPEYDLTDAPEADILAFFGGNSDLPVADDELIEWVRDRGQTVQYLFSVCTGARILGRAGFLDEKTVTTYHGSLEQLQSEVPSATVRSDVRWVDNGKVLTTAGVSAGIDGALHLVAKIEGKKAAKQIAQKMEYDYYNPDSGLVVKRP